MRELSVKEQLIIRNRLIKGATLPELFSEHFLENGKLWIHVNASGNHRFEFFSDSISSMDANRELVDTINLLVYLEREGLLTKYPPAATTMRDFEVDQDITIGNSTSQKSEKYLLIRESKPLVDFLKENDNYFFQANEPLRVLSENGFLTIQERQFSKTIRATVRGQFISVAIAVATMVTTITITKYTWNRSDATAAIFRKDLQITEQKIKASRLSDSLREAQQIRAMTELEKSVDSLSKVVSELKNKLRSRKATGR